MAWLELTLTNGELCTVNMDKFIFVKKQDNGSYLVASDQAQSISVKESRFYINAMLDAKRNAKMLSEESKFRNTIT